MNATSLCTMLKEGGICSPLVSLAVTICYEALIGSAAIPQGHLDCPVAHHQWWIWGGACHDCCV